MMGGGVYVVCLWEGGRQGVIPMLGVYQVYQTHNSSSHPSCAPPSSCAAPCFIHPPCTQPSTTMHPLAPTGEVGRLRQQVVGCREEVQLVRTEADKFARDLEDLSAAYNQLEAHSLAVEAQLRDAQLRGGSGGGGTSSSDGGVMMVGSNGGVPAGGGMAGPDVERLLEEARAATRAEVEEEQEESMNDLLVCLGQEEAKAQRYERVGGVEYMHV